MPQKTKFKIVILGEGCHPILTGKINGKPCRMLIDTGASKTIFDKNGIARFIKTSKLEKQKEVSFGVGGEMHTYAVSLNLKIGKLLIKDYKGMAMDLSNVNGAYESCNVASIDMVLGCDILLKHKFVIDYRTKELILYKK